MPKPHGALPLSRIRGPWSWRINPTFFQLCPILVGLKPGQYASRGGTPNLGMSAMATEYEKTEAYKRGLEGKTARSPWSIKLPNRDEIRENERGKRAKAYLDASYSRSKRK